MTDAELTKVIQDQRIQEGDIPYLYRDSAEAGNLTIGRGCMLPDLPAALKLSFRVSNMLGDGTAGQLATMEQIRAEWYRVSGMPAGRRARFYLSPPPFTYISFSDVEAMARKRLVSEFVPGLVARVHGFEDLPLAAKRAALDIVWNTGWSFRKFLAALGARDWDAAIVESHRQTEEEKLKMDPNPNAHAYKRNAWVVGLLDSCKRNVTA